MMEAHLITAQVQDLLATAAKRLVHLEHAGRLPADVEAPLREARELLDAGREKVRSARRSLGS